jgi:hypothetical protein
MFANESTENLLDNLEDELTEVVALDNPTKILTVAEIENEKMPPIPAKRNFTSHENLSTIQSQPVPAARRLQSLDKMGKNNENEIIQLSSMSSSSASENIKNYSQNTVVRVNERRPSNKVSAIRELENVPVEETFFVVKHGKWADEEEKVEETKFEEAKVENPLKIQSPAVKTVQPKLQIISETPKTPSKKSSLSSCTNSTKTSDDSSSETSSSSEESIKVKKKSKKKKKEKHKKKSKKKSSSDEQATSTETKSEEPLKEESTQAIGEIL